MLWFAAEKQNMKFHTFFHFMLALFVPVISILINFNECNNSEELTSSPELAWASIEAYLT